MANTLITPAVIAREILDRLYESTFMSQLVYRNYDGDFQGKVGDTITVRRPATFTAAEFSRPTGIVLQNATEASFTVVLDKLPDVSFAVTTEELSLKVSDFSAQFLAPAAQAIAQYVDKKLLATLVSASVTNTVGVDGTPSTNPTLLADAAKVLDDNLVPQTERAAVLTTTVHTNYVKSDQFSNADKSGDTEALRQAKLGHVYGLDIYKTTNMPTTPAGLIGDSVAFHKTAAALVTRTLETPMGISPSQVAVVNFGGLGLRVIQSYDVNQKQDVVSVDMLCGFKLMDATRAVRILG